MHFYFFKRLCYQTIVILLSGLTVQPTFAAQKPVKHNINHCRYRVKQNKPSCKTSTAKKHAKHKVKHSRHVAIHHKQSSQTSLLFAQKTKRPKISIQLGGFVATQGNSQNIYIQDVIGDYFSVNHNYGANALVGLGLYLDGLETQNYKLSYGINAFYFPHTTVKGQITQEQEFTNLAYSYSLTNLPVYLAAKARIYNIYSNKYHFTVDFGLGSNFIRTSNVNERSLDGGFTVPDMAFSGKTATTFSATAGIGIEFNNVFGSVPLECGYRFFYLGQSNFDKRNDVLLNSLNTGNNYANALLCSVSV